MPPHTSGRTSASGPVNELISFEDSDGDSGRVGYFVRTIGDQRHGPIHVELTRHYQPLEFEDGRKRSSLYATLLDDKRVR